MSKSGNTSVVSFSISLELLNFLDRWSREKGNISRSVAIRHFIELGRTYTKILDEQLADLQKKAVTGVKDAEE